MPVTRRPDGRAGRAADVEGAAATAVGAELQAGPRDGMAPSAIFVTRLTTPPAPPRPKIIAFGPFSTSTRSTL